MRVNQLFKILGPGIVWAATSIGVSHIVQSTRAGADFGFALVGFIFLAHLVKYPFFLFAPRYSGYTGKSLLEGYRDIGQWAFYLYLGFTFITMFLVQAGVTLVTAALAYNLFGNVLSVVEWAGVIMLLVSAILLFGHYRLLNESLKWIVLCLAALSLIAWLIAAMRLGFMPQGSPFMLDLTAPLTIAFVVALMGWMPTGVEVSVWHSLWTLSRFKKFGRDQAKTAETDFNVGYLTSLLLAIVFLWLGAILMFGQGLSFSNSAAAFAGQLVSLYQNALGDWSWLLMATITFLALFSTTFAVADGFPQVWQKTSVMLEKANKDSSGKVYTGSLILMMAGAWCIIAFFGSNIKSLLDFVTTLSFVSAPIYAWLNYRVMQSKHLDDELKPSGWFKLYTQLSLLLMLAFSLFFLYWRFF